MVSDATLLEISSALETYYSLFLIVVGTVCNILCFLILGRPAYSGTTFSIYFRYLAFIDLLTLYTGLIRGFVFAVYNYDITHVHEIVCKIITFTTTIFPDISAWILVAVTIERFVSIVKPLYVRFWFTRRNVRIILFALSVALVAINIPLLLSYGDLVVEESGVPVLIKCDINRPDLSYFNQFIWYWIDLTKFVLLPCTILSVLNAAIIRSVAKSKQALVEFNTGNNCLSSRRPVNKNNNSPLSITLIVVNVAFIVFNCPISIYLIGSEYWFPRGFTPKEQLTFSCCLMAMYTNNSANFILYCVTGSKFRSEIKDMTGRLFHMICRRRRSSTLPTTGNDKVVFTVSNVS